jgi:leader peptidase (prepilin peptidase)/N-methyltransferase
MARAFVGEPGLLAAILFLFGLLVGSFLNVVVFRLPRDQSIVRPRSRCPACGTPLRPLQNVPIVSWLALRGRCASCRAPILLPFHLLFVAAMIVIALIDLDFQIIPDEISLPGAALGLAYGAVAGHFVASLMGAAVGAGLLWGIGAAYLALRKVEGMGGGDVKLAAMLGGFLGWRGVLLTLFLASFAGALAGIALMRSGRGSGQTRIPFGTFLAPAGIVVLFAGEAIIDWYAGYFVR